MQRRDSLAVRLESMSGLHSTHESVEELVGEIRSEESAQREALSEQNTALREQVNVVTAQLSKEKKEVAQVRTAFENYQRLSDERHAATKAPSE